MQTDRQSQRFCIGLVLFAVAVRLLGCLQDFLQPQLQSQAAPEVFLLEILAAAPQQSPQSPETDDAETDHAAAPEAQTDISITSAAEEPPAAQPASTPLTFAPEEADAITITGACSYPVDKQTLLQQPCPLDFSQDGPTVLIVHTHSSEAYTMETGWEYQESDQQRTLDAQYSVVRVGDEIADLLTQAGISVLHDTTPNDYPDYNGAYERMRQTIEQYLTQYPTIQMVLDIHRDAAPDSDGNPVALTANVQGDTCAELMIVVGTDEGGLSHPDWQENLSAGLKLQALLNRAAPGLCRNLDLRTERFNQHETPGSLLVEVGASGNTLAEAIRSARILAQALIALVQGCSS